MNLEEAKKHVCHWAGILHGAGVSGGQQGAVSYRYSDVMIITPAKADLSKCIPADLVTVGLADLSWSGSVKPSPEYALHAAIYRRKKKINALVQAASLNILTASRAGKEVYPMLDDLAQIVGASVKVASFRPEPVKKDIASALKGLRRRSAVLLKDHGAICGGSTFDDAHAVAQVLEKGCKCNIESAFLGGGIVINGIERNLMRLVYVLKYSKAAESNK